GRPRSPCGCSRPRCCPGSVTSVPQVGRRPRSPRPMRSREQDAGETMSNATQTADGVAAAFTEHFVQADGLRIRYLEAGQGNPVVVLHGSGGLMPSPLDNLLARQFRVIACEIPDFSQSAVNERSQRDLACTLAKAVTATGL